jgi:hypothetical protein
MAVWKLPSHDSQRNRVEQQQLVRHNPTGVDRGSVGTWKSGQKQPRRKAKFASVFNATRPVQPCRKKYSYFFFSEFVTI